MSTTIPSQLRVWKQVKNILVTWLDGANSHVDLTNLHERTLRKIGLLPDDESDPPSWWRARRPF